MIDRLQVGCASKVHTLQPVFYLPCPAGPILQYGSRRSNPYLGGILMAALITIINCTNTLTFA